MALTIFLLAVEIGIVIAITLIILGLIGIIYGIFYVSKSYNKGVVEGQSIISDKEVIELINRQPDKIIGAKQLARHSGLSKSMAKYRLQHFSTNGLLKTLYTRKFGMKYTLSSPILKEYDIKLSNEPFMTLEDLIKIFKYYDYKVTLQQLCLTTGLPVKVLNREMKYFEDEKIVELLYNYDSSMGTTTTKMFVLREPYRSNPDSFLNLKDVNFELKEIFQKSSKNDLV